MGESLWTIADDHGISVEELKRINHRTSNVVMPGELLTVPGGRSSAPSGLASASKGTKSNSTGPAVHVVQRGESLSQIASAYKTSLSSLQSANKIRNPNLISPGQRLVIPGRSGTARAVKTMPTSTQSLASAQVRSQPRTEKARSKPSSEAIAPLAPPPGTMQNTSKSAPRSVVSYRVEGGDSIEAVARNFNTTPGEIQRINKLPAAKLPAVGEEIIVPLPSLVSL
ncbi:MAG: LysM peptidoglycan-binding domain-containing protein [Verrucomicrobiaceae bacterium]|nr:LysM peptidoglycan-binding domain-containing protein [Verrucomicrobiaceae bacterium]